ncbi:MAG: O-antigen ligase family protein, partial [Clostridia bacterium]|nr:O-antigen ligase family protein [Clostridia bacterium]
RALSSCFFPLVTAVVSVGCYYLGWDIVNIWYLCICGTAIMVCCKDVSPVLCLILFFSLLPSPQHSPKFGTQSSNYLVSPPILAQEIIGVIFFLGTVVFRLVMGIVKRKFKITPLFWGIIGLSAALILNGIFYTKYTAMNLLYGLALSGIIIVFYVFCYCNFGKSERTFKQIAYYLLAVFGAVTLEVGICYLTNLNEAATQSWRSLLKFGWGTYNQAGLLLTMPIPAWFYLAGKHKRGYFFLLGAVANVGMCYLSQSRQAMVMSLVVLCACCVWILIWDKGKKRIIDLIMMGVVLALVIIVAGIMHEKLLKFFSSALNKDTLSTGSGRTGLWKEGWMNFLRKPLFGVGFYDPQAVAGEVGYFVPGDLSHAVPRMCHNTIFELMSACGLVGLLAYAVHRTQPVMSFINNITSERVLIALTACVILLLSLLDNHIFGVFPTIIYSLLIAMLSATEKEKQPKKAKAEEVKAEEIKVEEEKGEEGKVEELNG